MKRQIFTILGIGLLAMAASAQDQKPAPKPAPPVVQTVPPAAQTPPKTDYSKIFKSDKEKYGYAIGMGEGANLRAQLKNADLDIDPEVLLKAFRDSLTGGTTQITEAQDHEILNGLRTELMAKRTEKQKEMFEKNKKDGEAFLAANKAKPNVKSFPSGLQYQVLTEGTGETPKATDTVTANYRGTLIDGTEFDSSKPGQPTPFGVTKVIPGWTEALEHMKVGSKWKLFIPANLAYGDRGSRPKITPNSALIFDIELVSVVHPAATPPAPPAPAAAGKPATGVAPIAQAGQPLTSDIIKVPSADELKKGAKIETIKPEDLEKEKAAAGTN